MEKEKGETKKKYIKNRKEHPLGVLHLKYKRLADQISKHKPPQKKKSKKMTIRKLKS